MFLCGVNTTVQSRQRLWLASRAGAGTKRWLRARGRVTTLKGTTRCARVTPSTQTSIDGAVAKTLS
jgi:hypothetical protein